MSARLELRALGVRVTIDAFGALAETVIAACELAWSSCVVTPGGGADEARMTLQVSVGERLAPAAPHVVQIEAHTLESALEWVTQHITVGAIERRAGELLMLHACAVADPLTGHAAVLVGPSGMGKTTLARTLGRRWAYLTDETAALDPDGSVLAYPKPLSLVSQNGPKEQLSPHELELISVPDLPLQLTGLFLLDRQPGCETAVVEEVAKLEAIALLAEHTSYLGQMPGPLRAMAAVIDAVDGVRRLTYTETHQVEPVLADLFGGLS